MQATYASLSREGVEQHFQPKRKFLSTEVIYELFARSVVRDNTENPERFFKIY